MKLLIYIGLGILVTSCSTKKTRVDINEKLDDRFVLINYKNVDRETISRALDHVNEGEPKVIGLNALFIELKNDKGDTLLSKSIDKKENVIIVSNLDENNRIKSSHEFFKNSSLTEGLISFGAVDNVATSYKPYEVVDNDVLWSFPISIVTYSDPALGDKLMRSIIPNEYYLVNIHRTMDKYQTFDIEQLDKVHPDQFKNKIVLFGYLGPTNEDLIKTRAGDMYVTVILANMISSLLDGEIIKDEETEERKTTANNVLVPGGGSVSS